MMNTTKLVKTKFCLVHFDTGTFFLVRKLDVVKMDVYFWVRRTLNQKMGFLMEITYSMNIIDKLIIFNLGFPFLKYN